MLAVREMAHRPLLCSTSIAYRYANQEKNAMKKYRGIQNEIQP
jgi:hypothetical protein